MRKLLRRFSLIGFNAASHLFIPFAGAALSLLVVRLCSGNLWGSMAQILLWANLASHCIAFGNREFLLIKFSREPSQMLHHWIDSFSARALILIFFLIILLCLPFSFPLKCAILVFLSARFVYQSYEPVIVYSRNFQARLWVEVAGFIFNVLATVFFNVSLNAEKLMMIYAFSELLKMALVIFLHMEFFPLMQKFQFSFFKFSFPFFLVGLCGLLQSKADLMAVTFYLTEEKIAQYQVITGFLMFIPASAHFILLPFVKNIYRFPDRIILKIAQRLFAAGIFISVFSVFLVKFIVEEGYRFPFDTQMFLLGVLAVLPSFYYGPLVFCHLKKGGQNKVIAINLACTAINFLLSFFFISMFKNGIHGALAAMGISQWALLWMYNKSQVS